MGKIIDIIEKNEFIIAKLKLTRMTRDDACQFYKNHSK
jgi:nucleoside diphosphate kinase